MLKGRLWDPVGRTAAPHSSHQHRLLQEPWSSETPARRCPVCQASGRAVSLLPVPTLRVTPLTVRKQSLGEAKRHRREVDGTSGPEAPTPGPSPSHRPASVLLLTSQALEAHLARSSTAQWLRAQTALGEPGLDPAMPLSSSRLQAS